MKVLILTTVMAPYRVDLFNELGKKLDLTVCFEQLQDETRNDEWYKKKFDNFKSIILKNAHKSLKNVKWNFVKRINNEYDIVIFYEYSTITSVISILKCQLKGIKYLINCDGAFIGKKSIKDFIKKICISKADGLLANGESAKKYFLVYGAKKEKIDIHYFSSLFKNDIQKRVFKDKDKLKHELGFNSNRLYLSVGNFDYRKGFELIIEAAHKISDYKSQYVFIGGGDKIVEYRDMCKKYNLNNFKFIEFLSKEELLKYYDAADAFILPTREDIWGLVINESMSRGLPVISTDRCNAALEMISKDNGIVVKSDSSDELSVALSEFNSYDEQKLLKMGENSLKVASKYNIEDIALKHYKTIKKVLKK